MVRQVNEEMWREWLIAGSPRTLSYRLPNCSAQRRPGRSPQSAGGAHAINFPAGRLYANRIRGKQINEELQRRGSNPAAPSVFDIPLPARGLVGGESRELFAEMRSCRLLLYFIRHRHRTGR